MDFCLNVTEISATFILHYAICFQSVEDRTMWIRKEIRSHVEFIAVSCDRKGLKELYGYYLIPNP